MPAGEGDHPQADGGKRLEAKMSCHQEIEQQIEQSISLLKALQGQGGILRSIAAVWAEAVRKGGKVILFGNGGSAADAQHIAAELVGKYYMSRGPLPAIALNTDTSVLTALSNDLGYENVFARQVSALARPGDVVVGISTSGNSPNVLLALREAKSLGATTVAFTGAGGKLKEVADYVLSLPSTDTPRLQEAHVTAGHIICYLVEKALFGEA